MKEKKNNTMNSKIYNDNYIRNNKENNDNDIKFNNENPISKLIGENRI